MAAETFSGNLFSIIPEDGEYGSKTKANGVKILQWAMNKDYDAGLVIDGDAGTDTKAAL